MRWNYSKPEIQTDVEKIRDELSISPVLAEILVKRGINTFDKAREYFRPSLKSLHDPFQMADMQAACDRLVRALEKEERILIYGDYDVDGTTSVAMFYAFLHSFYQNCAFYIPDRYSEGYGVSDRAIEWAAENKIGLIITLDCGIKSHRHVENARAKGIDFIICDHHTPSGILPGAVAVLDPKREDCPYPYKELSGCGVGFKFIQAFCEIHSNLPVTPEDFLDLVAVSIASDIVEITGENRVLAYYGLKRLANSPRPGLQALMKVADIPATDVSIMRIVFGLAPRINAAGRLEDAAYAVKLMLAENPQEARKLADLLDNHNSDRRELDRATTEEAIQMIQDKFAHANSTVLFNRDWHKGIIGIVASRCIETYYRPTVILTETKDGVLAGSARSVEGFDLYEALDQCRDYLIQFGGHKYAAGMTLHPDRLIEFREKFEAVVSNQITSEQQDASIDIDATLSLDQVTPKFFRILKQMGPFGPGNEEPVFVAHGLKAKNIKSFSSKKNPESSHLRFQCRQNGISFNCIGFKKGEIAEKLITDTPFSRVFVIKENEYKGLRSLQLQIRDIKLE